MAAVSGTVAQRHASCGGSGAAGGAAEARRQACRARTSKSAAGHGLGAALRAVQAGSKPGGRACPEREGQQREPDQQEAGGVACRRGAAEGRGGGGRSWGTAASGRRQSRMRLQCPGWAGLGAPAAPVDPQPQPPRT